MDTLENISELTDERLAEYAAELRTAIAALLEGEDPTDAQLDEAETYATALDGVQTEQTTRTEAAAVRVARASALRDRFAEEPEPEVEPEPVVEAAVEPEPEPEPVTASVAPTSQVRVLAAQTPRPKPPTTKDSRVLITAAPDVPGFAASSELTMEKVGEALVARMRGFGTPSGDGTTENLQHFGVAQFRIEFPEDLIADYDLRDQETLVHAADEKRLEGRSLVASGGWCAPSEILYDLCGNTGSLDGILSLPEVQARRGGLKTTTGPTFSDIYTNVGFSQTEAQAISGTTKTCYEVPCPTFTDHRLDIVGICIKAPILTNAAYPELVQEWLSGSMIAHQHKVNAKMLTAMATAAGTARAPSGLGAVSTDTFDSLSLYAAHLRQKYRMGLNETLEVAVPFYTKDILRADMSRRTGMLVAAVTDAQIAAEFAARMLQVSYVYDWQDLTLTDNDWPTTFQALMYPAGTFVKATNDVITLNAVYDAASLATNIYTALFFEQGVQLIQMCSEATLVTLPVCTAGRTGVADLACA